MNNENNEIKLRMLPKDFACPQCGFKLEWESRVSGDERIPRKNGDIIVCSNCVRALILRDDKPRIMSRREIQNLAPQNKTILKLAIISVMVQKKRDEK